MFLSYVDDCVYWNIYEAIGKWFVETPGQRFHVNFLEFSHWFMSIIISHLKNHYISVDQDKYSYCVVDKYIDTDTANKSTKFYKTTLTSDMIFSKDYVSTSYEKVEKLSRDFNI